VKATMTDLHATDPNPSQQTAAGGTK
jgi:hypothetical protein